MQKLILIAAFCTCFLTASASETAARCAGGAAPAIHSLMATPSPDGREFTFTAAASGNAELQYHWDFGDGTESPDGAATESHTYSADGTYTAQLIVSDGKTASEPNFVAVRTGSPRTVVLVTPSVTKKKFSLTFLKPQLNTLDFTFQSSAIAFPSKASFAARLTPSTVNVYIGTAQIDSISLSGVKGSAAGQVIFGFKKGTVEYKSKGFQPLAQLLAPFGAVDGNVAGTVQVPLEIDIVLGPGNGLGIFTTVTFAYSAKFDKKGTGK